METASSSSSPNIDQSSGTSCCTAPAVASCNSELVHSTPRIRYRFWLVRHGETAANRDGLVIGQWDSPLSDLGLEQSKYLGENLQELIHKVRQESKKRTGSSETIAERRTTGQNKRKRTRRLRRISKPWPTWFSRIYSSDLGRTKQTISAMMDAGTVEITPTEADSHGVVSANGTQRSIAETVHGTDHSSRSNRTANPVNYDERLREIAKGPRQGFPKSWTTEQALEERRRLELPITDITQETTSEAWCQRFSDFFASVMLEMYRSELDEDGDNGDGMINPDVIDDGGPDGPGDDNDDDDTVDDILVVTHAGSIRTILQHLVPDIHPSLLHKEYDPNCPPPTLTSSTNRGSDTKQRLEVPNTSVTILEMALKPKFLEYLEKEHAAMAILQGDDARDQMEGVGTNEDNDDAIYQRNQIDDQSDQSGYDLDLWLQHNNLWMARVVEFMWTGHLHDITTNDEE
mmetsp:Transcript_49383/g.119771  ORF Transcript_49383/g.119771 Transcript_49383/m.119771 type:complete len:460 (+) Transcript_49383:285-1664(+)